LRIPSAAVGRPVDKLGSPAVACGEGNENDQIHLF
jgi:hypothetical protein